MSGYKEKFSYMWQGENLSPNGTLKFVGTWVILESFTQSPISIPIFP